MTLSLTTARLIEDLPALNAGTQVLLTGTVYTARDAAHERLAGLITCKKALPLDLQNSIIYYCGPAPAKPGETIGPCGPTTSSRMDRFTPLLLEHGVKATIGKGPRSPEVREAIVRYGALYLVATGGVAALLARKVRKAEIIAFEDLGPEAIYRFEVIEFPLTVAIDASGNDVFKR